MPAKGNSQNKNTRKKKARKSTGKPIITGSVNAENLLIVESPAKAKTIQKYLGENFAVTSSKGHIADLPQKSLGVNIEHNFDPDYVVIDGKKSFLLGLKKLAKNYKIVWLATDEDREGEAIARHLQRELSLPANTPRITFNQITSSALKKAIDNPRIISKNLVDAQQGRRVLDRLVGFSLSPLLRQKIRKGLSAGRVQSIAVKIIIERENEIRTFIPQESRKLNALLETNNDALTIELHKYKEKKYKIPTRNMVETVLQKLGLESENYKETIESKSGTLKLNRKEKTAFELVSIKKTTSKRKSPPPFTTSTLQQEASKRYGWGVGTVMRIAQGLYESGHITYMRTDSINLSSESRVAIKEYIIATYGKQYYQGNTHASKKNKNAQEAHEAIRPTQFNAIQSGKNDQEKKLYSLIWSRAVASQMSDAEYDTTTYTFAPTAKTKNQERIVKGQIQKFDGFQKIYSSSVLKELKLPILEKGTILNSSQITATQVFSTPPARYSEATLVKDLESKGIGRPSTYAPTIDTIQKRGYVQLNEDKKLEPNDISFVVTSFLEENFSELMTYSFTADMEAKLDAIAEGSSSYYTMIKTFYESFDKEIKKAKDAGKKFLYVGKKCKKCGGNLVYKFSGNRKFIGCDTYPECKHTEPTPEEKIILDKLRAQYEGKPCPEGGTIEVKMGRYGPFLSSSEYPKIKWVGKIPDPVEEDLKKKYGGDECDECKDGILQIKKSRKRGISYFLGCSNYPQCTNTKNLPKK